MQYKERRGTADKTPFRPSSLAPFLNLASPPCNQKSKPKRPSNKPPCTKISSIQTPTFPSRLLAYKKGKTTHSPPSQEKVKHHPHQSNRNRITPPPKLHLPHTPKPMQKAQIEGAKKKKEKEEDAPRIALK